MKRLNYKHLTLILISLILLNPQQIKGIDLPETTTAIPTISWQNDNYIVSIMLNQKRIQLNKNESRQLIASVTYSNEYIHSETYTWSSNNTSIATVDQNGKGTAISEGKTYITVTSSVTNIVARCKVVVKKTKYIAFTFDDGPGIYTDKLLTALDKYHSKATFFVLGNRLDSYGDTLKRAYDLGMEIGNHSYSHPNLIKLSKKSIKKQINRTRKSIRKITGENPTLFRPPYGNYNKIVANNCKAPMIYWSVDFEDWKYKNTKYVYKKILDNAEDGEIILLHDIHKTTVKGFKKALPKLKKRGYELVTVSELYQIKGIDLIEGKMHFGPNYDK